ncbi:MAG: DEAD/DEAH box helicase [Candidatus Heimdallarchaeota archaeon]|nr:DEAD/DEAH box helicase [Candidatus Heimdallarchaeota archaeon]
MLNNLGSFSSVLQEIIGDLGFQNFTPIQEMAFPELLKGENGLIISATGSGKTEAALLPVFDQLIREREKGHHQNGINILYITPLRALNRDIFKRVFAIGEQLGIKTAIRHSDTTQYERRKQTLSPPHLLVTTPETLGIILTAKRLGEHLRNVSWVIVDEIHELVDSKRGTQLFVALERLKRKCGREFQRIGLSATIGDPQLVGKFLMGINRPFKILEEPTQKELEISIIHPQPALPEDEKIAEKIFSSPEATARAKKVIEIIKQNTHTLVFTNTRQFTEVLGNRLRLIGTDFPFGVHHGSLSKEVRKEAENRFKEGELKGIICTSSLELGIDIGTVDAVIQMMSSREIAPLLQRVGRSGHTLHKKSKGFIITIDAEDILEAAVICRKALNKELEAPKPHILPWEVLAHQIAGILLEESPIQISSLLSLLRDARPYKTLTNKKLQELLLLMKGLGLVWLEEDTISRRKRTLHYYFGNLSPIRDVKRYRIYDVATNRTVGSLDEEFVLVSGEVGTVFIVKGVPWKILAVHEDRVEVAPVHNPIGAIPAWEGELIPVPFSVAQEVGKLRAEMERCFIESEDKRYAKQILNNYPLDEEAKQTVVDFLYEHFASDTPMPTDKRIVIEKIGTNFAIIHLAGGSKVNQTLGHLVSSLLMTKFGSSVGMRVDPYRIILSFEFQLMPEHIEATIRTLKGQFVEELLKRSIPQTSMYEWRFVHIAKRFGVIRSPWEAGKIPARRIAWAYEGTLVEDATLKEILHDKMDIKKTMEALDKIHSQEFEIITDFKRSVENISPLGHEAIDLLRFTGFVLPTKPDRQLAQKVQQRLQKKKIRLICMWCGKYNVISTVGNLEERPKCPKCDARYLAAVSPRDEELYSVLKKHLRQEKLTPEEQKALERGFKRADLVIASGKKAIIALAARGVGPRSASKVLEKSHSRGDYEFYSEIIQAEKEYSRTRPFWGD